MKKLTLFNMQQTFAVIWKVCPNSTPTFQEKHLSTHMDASSSNHKAFARKIGQPNPQAAVLGIQSIRTITL